MQIALRCGKCNHQYLSDNDNDLSLEIDFVKSEIRYICKKCRKENVILLVKRDNGSLPSIGISRF
jgi:hypothetical protein